MMNIKIQLQLPLVLLGMSAVLIGCQKKADLREYKEIVVMPTQPAMGAMGSMDAMGADAMADPHQGLNITMDQPMSMPSEGNASGITWDTPKGWDQKVGQGMRLATFHSQDTAQPVECTIVSLGPTAGDIKANVVRWMGQIKINASEDQTAGFIKTSSVLTTKDGKNAAVFDFTQLQDKSSNDAASMIGAIIKTDSAVVFVKLTGSKAAVTKNKEPYNDLIRSIKFSNS